MKLLDGSVSGGKTRESLQFVLKLCELFIEASQVRIFIIKAAGCPVFSFQQKKKDKQKSLQCLRTVFFLKH